MSFLICSYASPHSNPDKIAAWIQELERLRKERAEDPQALQTIDVLLSKARGWNRRT